MHTHCTRLFLLQCGIDCVCVSMLCVGFRAWRGLPLANTLFFILLALHSLLSLGLSPSASASISIQATTRFPWLARMQRSDQSILSQRTSPTRSLSIPSMGPSQHGEARSSIWSRPTMVPNSKPFRFGLVHWTDTAWWREKDSFQHQRMNGQDKPSVLLV